MRRISSFKYIPRTIWALGTVSLLMDISTELIHSLLPIFMVSVLGANLTYVGIIEGIAESTALMTKMFSGTISDFLNKRKILVGLGYGLSAITKPLFPLANSLSIVLFARFFDRIGKGIRDAPRDALISDLAPYKGRGASFGLRQALDSMGAVIGPLMAMLFIYIFSGNIRYVFWIATIPAILAVLVLIFGVTEPEKNSLQIQHPKEWVLYWYKIRHLNKAFWYLLFIGGVLALARFSEAFLILKANSVGVSLAWLPSIMIVMNIAFASSSFPAGALSDVIGRQAILSSSILLLFMAEIILGFSSTIWMTMIGVIIWGLHMGLSQGLLAAMVADSTPEHLRGFAYGIFYFVCGIATLFSSIIAGMIGDRWGIPFLFYFASVFSTIAILALLYLIFRREIKI